MKPFYILFMAAAFTALACGNANAQLKASSNYSDANSNFKPQLGPNPAHNVIKVSWQQAQSGNVLMQLYTQSGTLYATLCNQNYPSGINGRTVNVSGIQRGTYVFRLTVPGQSWSTTLVLQ